MAKKPKTGKFGIGFPGPSKKELEALEGLFKSLTPDLSVPMPQIESPITQLRREMREIALEQEARDERADAEIKAARRNGESWRLAFFGLALIGAIAALFTIAEIYQGKATREEMRLRIEANEEAGRIELASLRAEGKK